MGVDKFFTMALRNLASRARARPSMVRGMASAEPRPSPRTTKEEEDALILARYGVMPNPGNQIKTPRSDNIIDWEPRAIPEPEAPAPTPSVLTIFGGKGFIGLMQFMDTPMVTRDQVLALQYDNVATGANKSLEDLDIVPASLGDVLPTYIK